MLEGAGLRGYCFISALPWRTWSPRCADSNRAKKSQRPSKGCAWNLKLLSGRLPLVGPVIEGMSIGCPRLRSVEKPIRNGSERRVAWSGHRGWHFARCSEARDVARPPFSPGAPLPYVRRKVHKQTGSLKAAAAPCLLFLSLTHSLKEARQEVKKSVTTKKTHADVQSE